ncbi:unnamed protein product, partial [Ectocarpus sp. 8 AP-2014]
IALSPATQRNGGIHRVLAHTFLSTREHRVRREEEGRSAGSLLYRKERKEGTPNKSANELSLCCSDDAWPPQQGPLDEGRARAVSLRGGTVGQGQGELEVDISGCRYHEVACSGSHPRAEVLSENRSGAAFSRRVADMPFMKREREM